jgi:Arc/MetJ-type ribon-helix-helix transcriptional regulator
MSIRLARPIEIQIEALVSSGEFSDANAVVADALALLTARQERLHRLRADLDIGRKQEERRELIELTSERLEEIKRLGRERFQSGSPIRDAVQP